MRPSIEKGLTLIELIVTITIMGIIAVAAMPLLSTGLEAHSQGIARSRLYQEGLLAMERMTGGVRRCTFLFIPNNHYATRDILAFSGVNNKDGDYYFNNPLFPKIDEDPGKEMTHDGKSGIKDVDDDGDGFTDEGGLNDDDEDGSADEDPLDGIDNDGDGNIDEDTGDEGNIVGMDDDGDGQVDEGSTEDGDEDGKKNEDPFDPVIYSFNRSGNTITEFMPHTGETTDLLTHVTDFKVQYFQPWEIRITLTLTGDDGETVEFIEHVSPRNVLQKTGKRVR